MESMRERYRSLKEEAESVRTSRLDAAHVTGGGGRYEEALIGNLDMRRRLQLNYQFTKRLVKITEAGLAALGDGERAVLESFYVNSAANPVKAVEEKLGIKKSQIYELKDAALKRFTISLFGSIEQ